MPESEAKNSSIVMMPMDVAQDGTGSRIHIRVAKAKTAMMRCCTTVRPSRPKAPVGSRKSVMVTAATTSRLAVLRLIRRAWCFSSTPIW